MARCSSGETSKNVSNLEQAPGYKTSEGLEVVLAEGSRLVPVLLRSRHGGLADIRDLVGRRILEARGGAPRTAGRLAGEDAP